MPDPASSTIAKYTRQAAKLMPPGRAFSSRLDSVIRTFLEAIGVPFARVHEDAAALRDELLPSQADELLDEWEEATGLPSCEPAPTTTEARQADLVSHLIASGGQSDADYQAIAAALGFDLRLAHEHLPMKCTDPCTSAVAGEEWIFHKVAYVGHDGAEDADLNSLLECRLNEHLHLYGHLKFSHTDTITVDGWTLTVGGEEVTVHV